MTRRRELTSIDLLPESILSQKRLRKRMIQLAAAQVAIFLCLGMAIVVLHILEGQAWDESHMLAAQVYNLRHSPAVAAAADTHDITLRIAAEDAFFEANAPADFNPLWLTAIISAEDGNMTNLDYRQGTIVLTGIVEDMNTIENLRQNLIKAEIFEYVRLGRIMLQDSGFFYELRLGVIRT